MVAAGSCRYFGFCATIMHLLGAFHGCIAQNEMYVDATASGDVRVPMILVFKDALSLQTAQYMCDGVDGEMLDLPIITPSLLPKCHVAGICKRIYKSAIKGISGEFTSKELQTFRECIPDGIKYTETDGMVIDQDDARLTRSASPLNSNADPNQNGDQDEIQEPLVTAFEGESKDTEEKVRKLDAQKLAQLVSSPGKKSQPLHVALWNLDRVDQQELPLDRTYRYGTNSTVGTGSGVTIYILDSGVRASHREFRRWTEDGIRVRHGYDFVDDDPIAEDCTGHGTHVASTAIGRSVGIAKQAEVVAIRVLGCDSRGNVSTTVAGLDWVINHHRKPAVVVMSLGVERRTSRSLEDSVKSMIHNHGITVVVASGNGGKDSCLISPGNLLETINVAASNLATKFGKTQRGDLESMYRWSNSGNCTDIFAPGENIYGACDGVGRCSGGSSSAYTWLSGTSMAAPHVAGVAAMYLGEYPKALPAEVKNAIISASTQGRITSEFMRPGTPNRLLYSSVFTS